MDTCTHCGDTLAPRRMPAPSYGRFCVKPACSRARAKARKHLELEARRARRAEARTELEMEDRPCTGCGDPMPARPKRTTDRPEGRWCLRYRCQRERDAALAVDPAVELYRIMTAGHARFFAAPKVTCPTCETEARDGFKHGECIGLGLQAVLQPLPPPAGVNPCDCAACARAAQQLGWTR